MFYEEIYEFHYFKIIFYNYLKNILFLLYKIIYIKNKSMYFQLYLNLNLSIKSNSNKLLFDMIIYYLNLMKMIGFLIYIIKYYYYILLLLLYSFIYLLYFLYLF